VRVSQSILNRTEIVSMRGRCRTRTASMRIPRAALAAAPTASACHAAVRVRRRLSPAHCRTMIARDHWTSTYGKGSAQSVILFDKGGLKITTRAGSPLLGVRSRADPHDDGRTIRFLRRAKIPHRWVSRLRRRGLHPTHAEIARRRQRRNLQSRARAGRRQGRHGLRIVPERHDGITTPDFS